MRSTSYRLWALCTCTPSRVPGASSGQPASPATMNDAATSRALAGMPACGRAMFKLSTSSLMLSPPCEVPIPANAGDFLYSRLTGARARDSVSVDFAAAPQLGAGALAGTFDIVLGGNTAG